MQTVESVSDTRFIATQKLVAGNTHMDLPEVLFHARDDGLTSHADPERMTTDESFDTRSLGTGLDNPPSRDGGEPSRSGHDPRV